MMTSMSISRRELLCRSGMGLGALALARAVEDEELGLKLLCGVLNVKRVGNGVEAEHYRIAFTIDPQVGRLKIVSLIHSSFAAVSRFCTIERTTLART